MARTNTLGNFLTDVADAIRTKKGSEELIAAEDFDTEIENLPSGGGDLDEYFVTEITENTVMNGGFTPAKLVKKYPDITVTNNVTSLYYGLANFGDNVVPKLIFGNNVTNISSLFNGDSQITEVDVSGFDTSNVTTMNNLFKNCSNLTNIDLSNFDTSSIQSMQAMFSNCKALASLDLSNFNTFETVTNQNNTIQMFQNCLALTHIDMRNFRFNFSNSSMYENMFGASATNGVPDNCEIIVADNTQKTWVTTNFSRLTNVKTVAEYEAEQNA